MKVKIMGGLGNQLFIYSFGYALSKENQDNELILDTENYDIYNGPKYMLDFFQTSYSKRFIDNRTLDKNKKIYKLFKLLKIKLERISIYEEKELFSFDNDIYKQTSNTLFIGYWQNYRYFDNYKHELIKQFRLKEVSNELNMAIEMIDNDAVAVHVRRGDYKTYLGGKCLDKSYYLKSIEHIKKNKSNAVFYVFTDDPDYCKKLFDGYNIVVVSDKYNFSDLEEFYYMSRFNNFIIANSTFSWWAAYLSDSSDVFAPVVDMWKDNFYPDNWKKIDTIIEEL